VVGLADSIISLHILKFDRLGSELWVELTESGLGLDLHQKGLDLHQRDENIHHHDLSD